MLVLRACGARQNFYEFSLHRNADIDDRISEMFPITSMAAVNLEFWRSPPEIFLELCPVGLSVCSVLYCSTAATHLKLQD